MNKTVTFLAAAAALATIAIAPANAGMSGLQLSMKSAASQDQIVHKTGKKGKFAAGLIVGLGTAAILSHGGHGYYSGYSYRHERRCRRWRRRCWNGNGNACWKFDRRC